jgi:hypothetical protein
MNYLGVDFQHRFEFWFRQENLSLSHHREEAPLELRSKVIPNPGFCMEEDR